VQLYELLLGLNSDNGYHVYLYLFQASCCVFLIKVLLLFMIIDIPMSQGNIIDIFWYLIYAVQLASFVIVFTCRAKFKKNCLDWKYIDFSSKMVSSARFTLKVNRYLLFPLLQFHLMNSLRCLILLIFRKGLVIWENIHSTHFICETAS
jgi:hypothetical protein